MGKQKNKKRTAVTVTETRQIDALKIAKQKGINKFSTLIDILLAEYIESNSQYLQRDFSTSTK
jgi:hypothetical protein